MFVANLTVSAQLNCYSNGGEIALTDGDNPEIILKSTSKGVAWLTMEKNLTGDFNVRVKVSGIKAYNGGYQFRLITPDALKAGGIDGKAVGLNIVCVYFSTRGKSRDVIFFYRDLNGKLYSFVPQKDKWVAGFHSGCSWDSKSIYWLTVMRKNNEITLSITAGDGKTLTTAPIDASTIQGGTAPCRFMLGDAMRQYSRGTMKISSLEINGKKIDIRQLAAKLLSGGVFTFGKNQGYLQLPANYDPKKKYPFILFFHGRGGSAERNNFNCRDFAKFRKLCADKGFIVAVPGYGSDCWMNDSGEKITLDMIKFLERKLSIDNKRFYVMGCSMGGGAALVFTARHPGMVKAVCDIFGVTDFVKFYNQGFYNKSISNAYGGTPLQKPEMYHRRSAINCIDMLKQKPLLIIHGDRDRCVPKWNSDQLVTALKEAEADISYIIVPKTGHSNAIIRGLENKVIVFFEKYQ